MMVADDLELAMVEVSNEPLGSSGCRRRCRCCGSFVVAEMALKPKSKHKEVSTKTKNEGCCQNFGQAELPVLRGGTSGPGRNFRYCGAELPVAIRSAGCSSIWAEIRAENLRIRGKFGTKSSGKVGELQINTKDKFLLDQNHSKLNQITYPSKGKLGLFLGNFLENF
jgi:hypothetical protein